MDNAHILIPVLALVLAAEFVNGVTDAPNAIATVVSTRVLPPLAAVVMAAVFNLVGAVVTGTAVAATIGKGFVKPEIISLSVVAAAMITIVLWTIVAWRLGLPTSKSHELVAGLTGAGLSAAGVSALLWGGWEKVIIGLFVSTLAGFTLGIAFMVGLYWILRHTSPTSVYGIFSKLQIASSAFMAFSHGSNDGQKFMGVFALALLLGGAATQFHVTWWIILVCGTVMGLGTIIGGWRIMRTVGFKLTKLEPVNGFAAEAAGGTAITVASAFGIPLSTTHTINTAIMGVGATRRLSAVRWDVARRIVAAWILTFPACFALGWILEKALGHFL
jgi:inorganic phosphate transporter, PiT family